MIRSLAALALALTAFAAQAETLKLAVTTPFAVSGLSDVLWPALEADTGISVQMQSGDTVQVLALGETGQVDAILVRSRRDEETFIATGFGTHCRQIMYDDFVLVGPVDDHAGIAQARSVTEALQRIAKSERRFVSYSGDSVVQAKEQALWADAGLMPQSFPNWYSVVSQGSLSAAVEFDAYALTDRASWLKFDNKASLAVLFSGDPVLFNQYSFVPLNPERHPHVAHDLAERVETWLSSPRAAELINTYTVGGEPLFTFSAE
ncbi:substrate-binding domain-containing protein [Pseudosulfitobacter sp. DSM 107133]|uniref:substrate-binding domain-containing protein n=1 Tax=Pseudosulfitobacter sp. DSM 107133 TaxID=2883100 RepID=UPI000DF3A4C3|nr:substrate-binding domain-containing protein [Pseudosulfitobacter sp. DSM 107133]UOA28552.1 Tungstate-binding protein TupA [Pseudosulfitobacter sp. DSM 107133]